jgi:hypothetical protein
MLLRSYPGQINDINELVSQIDRQNLILVEIGSFRGESMELFAKSLKFSKIFCVDPWQNGYDDNDLCSSLNFAEIEKSFDDKVSKYDFVTKIKKNSKDASNDFQDKSIDVIYIDGLHTPDAVESDIRIWFPKIKDDGYICGHDWYLKDGFLQESIIRTIGYPDYVCKHVVFDSGESDGSWMKRKINIKL